MVSKNSCPKNAHKMSTETFVQEDKFERVQAVDLKIYKNVTFT